MACIPFHLYDIKQCHIFQIHQTAKALAAHNPKYVEPLTELLEPKLTFYQDEQRIVAMAVLSAFVK